MQFEPRVFRDDDEPHKLPSDQPAAFGEAARDASTDQFDQIELELPAGLAALGEQLADDADHLAHCYPAGRSAESMPSTPATLITGASAHARRQFIRWGGAAAAVLIALCTWQFVAARLANGNRPENRIVAVDLVPGATGDASVDATPANDPSLKVQKPILGDSGLPSSFFRRLTGAEQEAVLDLMQDDPQGKAQLSI
jgi:hypothetical protein